MSKNLDWADRFRKITIHFAKTRHYLQLVVCVWGNVQYFENYRSLRGLLNRWPRKPGDKVVLYLVSGKTKSVMAKLRLRRRKYFEWIIKQLLNSAFVGYEEFCRSRPLWITPSLICRILHILRKPNSIIAKYTPFGMSDNCCNQREQEKSRLEILTFVNIKYKD